MAAAEPRRSLIMAGGGMKVAFQAGVLQVWLDEARIPFNHADGASGGVFNLAMWCQGLTGTEIADNWRRYRPLHGIQANLGQLVRLPFAASLFRMGRFRRNVFRDWGLDWEKIRASDREATFNLYNFSRHEQLVLTPAEMDEDRLVSAVSLPMWFPPVKIGGDTYIDAVFATDANLIAAADRGADELWIVWTVSERGDWHNGFVADYFQMIEAMANGHLRADLERIRRNNDALARGEGSEWGRRIDVKILRAEVPVHYLIGFSHDRFAAAVELGVQSARRWCANEGIVLPPAHELEEAAARNPHRQRTGMRFSEGMAGFVAMGERDYVAGERDGRATGTAFSFHLTMEIDDMDRFVVDPEEEATARGWVECEALGGRLEVERGVFNLFVDEGDYEDKRMLYRLWFRDRDGRPLTMAGHKLVSDNPGFDLWADTTTLYTVIAEGHCTIPEAEADGAPVIAAGILRLGVVAVARLASTFRGTGPTAGARALAVTRFVRLFVGSLWDVYARDVLSASPI